MARILMRGGGGTSWTQWFGDGSDGDAVISSNTDIPVTEDSGHVFKQYRSLTINAGATLKPAYRCAGMVILVRGDCTINGAISMDLMAPRSSPETEAIILNSGVSSPWLQKISSLNGGAGGAGGYSGGAGGPAHRFGGGYGGGGGGRSARYSNTDRVGGSSNPRPPITIQWPYPGTTGAGQYGAGGGGDLGIIGGAAPGGSGANGYRSPASSGEAGSAYGGGLLLLVVGGYLVIGGAGQLTAVGGVGAGTGNGIGWGGGGGGGGGIVALLLKHPMTLSGNIIINGGTSGVGDNGGSVYYGTNGSVGTIYTRHLDDSGNVTNNW